MFPNCINRPALILLGAGREKKIYAVPPYTKAEPLAFDDIPFRIESFFDEKKQRRACARCDSRDSFLDEFSHPGSGEKIYQCSDSDYCNQQLKRRQAHG